MRRNIVCRIYQQKHGVTGRKFLGALWRRMAHPREPGKPKMVKRWKDAGLGKYNAKREEENQQRREALQALFGQKRKG